MKNIFLFAISLILFISCGSSKNSNTAKVQIEDYKSIATKKLGEDVNFFMNESESYVLCTYEITGSTQQPRNSLYYMVIKIDDNAILMENKIDGGTVTWFDDDEIEVYLIPGMVRKDQTVDDFKTLYDVKTGKPRPKLKVEKH